jgi:FlaA1/EpsC-like NDP-sugar epimerase
MFSRRAWIAYVIQSVIVCIALLLSWALRFELMLPQVTLVLWTAPLLVAIRGAVMHRFHLAHSYWRYTGMGDLKDLSIATTVGSVIFLVVTRWILGLRSFPYSIYLLEWLFSFVMLAALRVGARKMLQAKEFRRAGERTPALIVGAGSAAALLLQALKHRDLPVVGLVDDDPAKQKMKLYGVPVLGGIDQLPEVARRSGAREILIAIPSANGRQMLRISELCGRAGLPYRAVPSLADLIEGKVAISQLRQVNLDDLLGRDPVCFEADEVRAKLADRVVMVTGAAGSIGSELCKQILRCSPAKLICVDRAETPLFDLQQRILVHESQKVKVVFSVADITDSRRMRQLINEHGVRVIFHAAAYKHVPLTEANSYEAIKNNVFGLLALVESAEESGCEDFVLISSDKAVKPSSLMGCTKRLGEMIAGSRPTSGMRCVSVRFGNVLGSQGSVVPVFQEQIRTRGCVTVTHPQMTRYFMTIPEAVALVLQAFTVGEHGDILVLDMGQPVRIVDLARTLIRISGNNETRVPIVYTGMRPGEKLHEELFYDSERRLPTSMSKVMRAQGDLPKWTELEALLQRLQLAAQSHDPECIRARIKDIIPEYLWEPAAPSDLAARVAAEASVGPSPRSAPIVARASLSA